MKRLTTTRKPLAFSLSLLLLGASVALSVDLSLEQSIDLLRKHRSKERTELVAQVFAKAKDQPAFRTELINRLTELISSYEEDYKGANEIRSLRELGAKEALPHLRARWDKMGKKVHYLERGDPRIQLLLTIAKFLPEAERIQFFIDTQKDEQEAPKVRFRATLLLCASGNERGIQHVLSAYAQARQKHSRTVRMSLENQIQYLRDKEERGESEGDKWDKDMDMMTDYFEHGMLLDASNRDTDGDGILDGNDRNPLCTPKGGDAEVAGIAEFLFYLHGTYSGTRHGPFPFAVWIAGTVDNFDGKGRPSIFDGAELTGVDAVVLHMSPDQVKKYRAIHGYATPIISIHELNDTQNRLYVKLLGEKGSPDESLRTFSFSEYVAPEGAASWLIRVKRVHGVWLPVYWKMTLIS